MKSNLVCYVCVEVTSLLELNPALTLMEALFFCAVHSSRSKIFVVVRLCRALVCGMCPAAADFLAIKLCLGSASSVDKRMTLQLHREVNACTSPRQPMAEWETEQALDVSNNRLDLGYDFSYPVFYPRIIPHYLQG